MRVMMHVDLDINTVINSSRKELETIFKETLLNEYGVLESNVIEHLSFKASSVQDNGLTIMFTVFGNIEPF
jgi:hypothetical protein